MIRRVTLLLSALLGLSGPLAAQPAGSFKVTWKKTVLDKLYRSEGVGVADVNKDGKKDVIVGDVWYEAPDWKMHVLAKERAVEFKDWGNVIDKGWAPVGRPNMTGYSESFGVFPDDFNGDGWIDVIVAPFPGKACYWYENPGEKGGLWTQHFLTNSACNETPIYVDLFGAGKKSLVMGWQPEDSKGNMGEMCYFVPGKPWQRISISGPSNPGKEIPGTQRFSHGLGHGDVNGDGRIDIICTNGWWEQPERSKVNEPWKFHAANLGPACADMHVFDVDGDGKNDIIASSAHLYGFWWYQQKSPTEFVQRELFPLPTTQAQQLSGYKLSKEASTLFTAINTVRQKEHLRAPWRPSLPLSQTALAHATAARRGLALDLKSLKIADYKGSIRATAAGVVENDNFDNVVKDLFAANKLTGTDLVSPALEVGVAVVKDDAGKSFYAIILGDSRQFSLPSQTHALHFVDINGDGQKDLVTGRRWWAHGPKGDAGPNDPAYIFWFEARKGRDGSTTFIPHEVDDDSGIGTQFAVEDINGDGIPDIIVSNKRGVYVLVQVRTPVEAAPPKKE